MRRQRRFGVTMVVGVITLWMAFGGVASGVPVCLRNAPSCLPGYVTVSFGAHVIPTRLSKKDHAPVTWAMSGRIGKADGGHPPALREVELDIDKDVRVDAEGYPACGPRRLEGRSSRAAMRSCREAFLGEGRAHVEVASAEGASPLLLPSRLLVFNAAASGDADAKLLIHAHFVETTPATIVTAVTLQEKGGGLATTAKIPPIAAGLGSIVDFELDLGATYSRGERKVGYFEARCPDGVFKASVKKILFKNEAGTPGEGASTQLKGSLAVPCTGRR